MRQPAEDLAPIPPEGDGITPIAIVSALICLALVLGYLVGVTG